jgi:imidazolonepropionase-like amidohydrolase
MSRLSFFFLLLALATSLPAADLREINPPPEPAPDSQIAIVNARLIDGRGGHPLENAAVLIRGSKITAAGPQTSITIPEEAKRLDATGLTLLPGLIDTHFHSRNDPVRPIEYELNRGITTFRDPGHPFRFYDAVRAAQAAEEKTFPRIFLCGAHLDAHPLAHPDHGFLIHDADHARRTVNEHVDHGATAIKIYMRLPLDHIAAACEAAKQRGVLVTAHLELIDADAAIRVGVRGIEHITSFGTVLAEPEVAAKFKAAVEAESAARHPMRYMLWSTLDLDNSPRVKPLLDLIVRDRVVVSPTLTVFEKRAGQKGATESDAAAFANMVKFTGMCHRAGAKIVVGSHTSGPHAEKGRAYQRELELLADAGLSPLEILTAATKNGAEFFGIENRLGTIEPGKLADLVLVEGDPSKDIAALKDVRKVMLNGLWQQH